MLEAQLNNYLVTTERKKLKKKKNLNPDLLSIHSPLHSDTLRMPGSFTLTVYFSIP